jgi:putative toxin-antitoxin system antitoxin component (TIGR02293 family)
MALKMKKRNNIYEEKEEILNNIEEPAVGYYSTVSTPIFNTFDTHHFINTSRNGITMRQLENIMSKYELTLKETATILNISERTLQRYLPTDILSKDVSDRTLHLQRLYERGTDVFGSLDSFKGWMKSPIFIYKNQKPISFLDTIFGFELLEQELGRIEHGIFA